ncbi:two-component sensor histidine kinase [Spongiactinospora rosea]|uniref:histidine kinase n=1 Tax=Spongiactinospora rosea TaxID=2248750 RepID=A0A366LX62_9ACTN|nr:histidine kinase [Spongiactinospora rosea]RBQ17782.1 two-component sensor histidine kinase [Spongiactinospora rosea]
MRRDLLAAGLAFAGGLVLLATGASVGWWWSDTPTWVLAGPLALVCAGVAVRRRAPLVALGLGLAGVAGDLWFGPTLGTILIFTDNLYSATLYGPRRLAQWMVWITCTLAVLIGSVTGVVLWDWRWVAVAGVQAGLVLTTPVFSAVILRQHRDQAQAERARAEQVARLAELDRRAAVNAERARMARELHDMIANHFSAIAIQSTAVLSRRDLDGEAVHKVLGSIRENSVQGLAEMRAMIELLRQEGGGEQSETTRRRLADSEDLVERARQSGVDACLRVSGEPAELPASVDLAGYRIVQEALTNVLKHGGRRAEVAIDYVADRVTVTVENPVANGRARLPGAGTGLIGMKERTALVGGLFEAGPFEGGWRVWAELPATAGALPGAEG